MVLAGLAAALFATAALAVMSAAPLLPWAALLVATGHLFAAAALLFRYGAHLRDS
jgi:hypothetical protein